MTSRNKTNHANARSRRASKARVALAALVAAAALLRGPAAVAADEPTLPTTAPAAIVEPAAAPAEAAPAAPVEIVTAPVVAALETAPAPVTAVADVAVPTTAPATRPAAAPGANGSKVVMLEELPNDGTLTLLIGRSLVLKTRGPVTRVSSAQPDVVAHNEPDNRTVVITARKAGSGQLIVWDDADQARVVNVVVEVDLNALDAQMKKTFPGTHIDISAANGAIVLRGRVPNLQIAEQATELVTAYGKALNFLELAGGQQVILQVRFAEISRSASTQLGFNAFASDGKFNAGYLKGPGDSPIGGIVKGKDTTISPAVTLFGTGQVGRTALEGFIQAMRSNNLLRVLAEPNLIAMSGKEANFLAGGEFPIPVPQASGGGNTITIDYKQFGVRLTFLPVVLGDGKIRLQMSPEVSDIDPSRSISLQGYTIPALTKRTVTTTIELNEGQTFAVAGLMNARVTAANDVVPLLGDLPIFGSLFRSVRYERNETELLVLVTPRLVEGMNPGQVPALPGEFWTFPTENDLFWTQYLGGPTPDPKAPAGQPAPTKFHGPYGFTPAEK